MTNTTPTNATPTTEAQPPPSTVEEADVALAGEFLSPRTLGLVLVVCGVVGFAAAFVLAVEKFWLLTNPFYTPSCSINARFSCTSVMNSPQAEAFGFPNPLLGIAGFAVIATTAAVLLAGGRLAGWYWAGLQAGATAGVVFVHWLMWQSIVDIGALCPYCMVVWAVTITTFIYITTATLSQAPQQIRTSGVARLLRSYHSAITAVWLLAVAGAVTISSMTA